MGTPFAPALVDFRIGIHCLGARRADIAGRDRVGADGIIVNIASIAGLFPCNGAGAYSVVKAGLIEERALQADIAWDPKPSLAAPLVFRAQSSWRY
jgi:NAD(P)-dependent dehydrogenase (short-subunit alcohol dehydrogenase family)